MSEAWTGRPDIDDESARRLALASNDGRWMELAEALIELTRAMQQLDRATYRVRRIAGQLLLDSVLTGDDPHEFEADPP